MTKRDAMRAAAGALTAMCQNFPTDSDLIELGWATHEINAACDAYDKGRSAPSLLRAALEEGEEPHCRVQRIDLKWAALRAALSPEKETSAARTPEAR